MNRTLTVDLSALGLRQLDKWLSDWKAWLEKKSDELANKFSKEGYVVAYQIIAEHVFSGATLNSLHTERIGPANYVVRAESVPVLFLEFGSGLRGYGYPADALQGMGPGTYPGQTHALDPRGWWFETDDPRLVVYTDEDTGKSYGHSYGMAPAMPMYTAVKELEQNFDRIVKEVFNT